MSLSLHRAPSGDSARSRCHSACAQRTGRPRLQAPPRRVVQLVDECFQVCAHAFHPRYLKFRLLHQISRVGGIAIERPGFQPAHQPQLRTRFSARTQLAGGASSAPAPVALPSHNSHWSKTSTTQQARDKRPARQKLQILLKAHGPERNADAPMMIPNFVPGHDPHAQTLAGPAESGEAGLILGLSLRHAPANCWICT
jgi:hypothetical protein